MFLPAAAAKGRTAAGRIAMAAVARGAKRVNIVTNLHSAGGEGV